MKYKIDWQQLKNDPLHPVWIAANIIVLGVLVYLVSTLLPKVGFAWPERAILTPYISAGAVQVSESIDRFMGISKDRSVRLVHILLVLQTIFTYVVVPTLLVWGLRARSLWRQADVPRPHPFKIIAALALGGLYLLAFLFMATIGCYQHVQVAKNMIAASSISLNHDILSQELTVTGYQAQAFYFLPVRDGGGGGRWREITGSARASITLDDISNQKMLLAKIIEADLPEFPQKPNDFVMEVVKEDSLIIWGIGNEPGTASEFRNKNGREGRVQLRADITPETVRISLENF